MSCINQVVQIELNEVSKDIISNLCKQGKLPNFSRVMNSWQYVSTQSEDRYENIEPWIQWVTAHTGKTHNEHGVSRLSDSDKLIDKSIWEILSARGKESGIVGCMNARYGNTNGGFFFPDPWSKNSKAFPQEMQGLWNIIHSKVVSHAVQSPGGFSLVSMLNSLRMLNLPLKFYLSCARQIIHQKLDKKASWKLAAKFDELLFYTFKSLYKKTNYSFYAVFLNAVAHYQHHFWRRMDPNIFNNEIKIKNIRGHHNPIEYGYKIYDKMLGDILELSKKNGVLVMIASGLSQIPYLKDESQGGMNYYRPKDHKKLCQLMGIMPDEIYPLMSRDFKVKFHSKADCIKFFEHISSITVLDEKLFNAVMQDREIFIEVSVTRHIPEVTLIKCQEAVIGNFHQLFKNTAIKSGHHTGDGHLWLSKPIVNDKKIPLTELINITLNNIS